MKSILSAIPPLLVMMLTSCVHVSMNHYQDGRSLGKGNFSGGIGLSYSRVFVSEPIIIDDSGYMLLEHVDQQTLPIFSVSGRYGKTENLDVGGELFGPGVHAPFPSGFRIYSKYAFLDSLSKSAIAIMPVIGYALGSTLTRYDPMTNYDWEGSYNHGLFILELHLMMSYHINRHVAFTFSPAINYYNLKSEGETGYRGRYESKNERYRASRSFFSPAFSLGFQYRIGPATIIPELTLVKVGDLITTKMDWRPYFGIGFFKDFHK